MKTFATFLGAAFAVALILPILIAIIDTWTWIVLGYPTFTDWTVWKALAAGVYTIWVGAIAKSVGKELK